MGPKQWAALMLRHKLQILVATDFKIELFDNKQPDKKFDEKNLVFVLKKVSDEEFKKLQQAEIEKAQKPKQEQPTEQK
jgi:hypothetical protein